MAELIVLLNESRYEYILLDNPTQYSIKILLKNLTRHDIWRNYHIISTKVVSLKYLCQNNYTDITDYAMNKLNQKNY